jgi:hypothetical protein
MRRLSTIITLVVLPMDGVFARVFGKLAMQRGKTGQDRAQPGKGRQVVTVCLAGLVRQRRATDGRPLAR